MLQQFLKKTVKLVVRRGESELIFVNTRIEEVTDLHVIFLDKYGGLRTFLISDVVEIQEVKQ